MVTPPDRKRALVPVLLGLTVVTGLVDAASVLGLGREWQQREDCGQQRCL